MFAGHAGPRTWWGSRAASRECVGGGAGRASGRGGRRASRGRIGPGGGGAGSCGAVGGASRGGRGGGRGARRGIRQAGGGHRGEVGDCSCGAAGWGGTARSTCCQHRHQLLSGDGAQRLLVFYNGRWWTDAGARQGGVGGRGDFDRRLVVGRSEASSHRWSRRGGGHPGLAGRGCSEGGQRCGDGRCRRSRRRRGWLWSGGWCRRRGWRWCRWRDRRGGRGRSRWLRKRRRQRRLRRHCRQRICRGALSPLSEIVGARRGRVGVGGAAVAVSAAAQAASEGAGLAVEQAKLMCRRGAV